ncbi:MAG: ABC transporter substrate-binding protein [Clostridium fessum]
MYYQQDVIQAVANQGTKIKSIGAIVQSPLSIVLSLKDKNITSPENLVGKTVGYGGTALSEAVVEEHDGICGSGCIGCKPDRCRI